jgi:hypothetical protein
VAWGYNDSGETNVPAGLTNIVAISTGLDFSLALSNNGTVAAWGDNTYGQCNVPSALTNTGANVMAIAAGDYHCVALLNTGYLVAWGDNSSGQTNTSKPLIPGDAPPVMKLIAAGGDHTLAAIWSPWVQYPVDVTKDLLLIYATGYQDSGDVLNYYLANRPMVSSCTNIVGFTGTNGEDESVVDFNNNFFEPVTNWLATNPTKRPSYVIIFPEVPSRLNDNSPTPSIQYILNSGAFATNWHPFVTSINMNGTGGTNDCIAYINKLASMASNNPLGTLFISATAVNYGNTNWYFDDGEFEYNGSTEGLAASNAVVQAGVSPASVFYLDIPNDGNLSGHITSGVNVAGFFSWGTHGYYDNTNQGYATNGTIHFTGQSSWYVMKTLESFNGQRIPQFTQGNFISWFSSNAFTPGGTNSNYANTPVGAVCNVDEPGLEGNATVAIYFGLWASGKNLAICGWNARNTSSFQVVGDPFVRK